MISIITPVYDGEGFIEPCIKTVIGRNCDAVERSVVDGGSTDESVGIIEGYTKEDPFMA